MVEQIDIPENSLKWCSVSLSEVMSLDNRLEASVFKIDAKNAREQLRNSKYNASLMPLSGENSFAQDVFYPNRFKRIYIEKSSDAIEFYLPSQLNEICPRAKITSYMLPL